MYGSGSSLEVTPRISICRQVSEPMRLSAGSRSVSGSGLGVLLAGSDRSRSAGSGLGVLLAGSDTGYII